MLSRARCLAALLALAFLSACMPVAAVPAGQVSETDAEPTHCELWGLAAQTDNYPAELIGVDREAARTAETLEYDRACSVFAERDAQLRSLVLEYLDLYQDTFGGTLVRNLDYFDGVVAMRRGDAHVFERNLIGGVRYVFIGACDNECEDVDLMLLDRTGAPVLNEEGEPVQDVLVDNYPVVVYTPPRGGDYLLQLSIFSCSAEPCYAGVRVLEQRANWAMRPNYGAVQLNGADFPDPHVLALDAGGYVDMQRRLEACAGFITDSPDYRVLYDPGESRAPLIFSANSDADTTLVINGPDGRWHCDDDGGVRNLNPMLMFEAPRAGQYDVWVGLYGEAGTRPARLVISQSVSQ
jgi:hypothetical protein